MSRYTLGILGAACALGLSCSSARADIVFSIEPSAVSANLGDTADSFDVVLSNTGSSAISVSAFAFEVAVNAGVAGYTDITLTGADFNTGATPYIFPLTNSFDSQNSFTLNIDSGQYLDASDGTNDATGVTVGAGDSVALGDVLFSVSPTAAPGPIPVTFSAFVDGVLADENNMAGPCSPCSGGYQTINVDDFEGGTIDIQSPTTVPEPSAALPLAVLLGALLIRRSRRVA
jgi:hypothetical protein